MELGLSIGTNKIYGTIIDQRHHDQTFSVTFAFLFLVHLVHTK